MILDLLILKNKKMNIVVNTQEVKIKNTQPKIYDLGEITTTLQDLLDNSKIIIDSYQPVILQITNLDNTISKYFLIIDNYSEDNVYGLGSNITESNLIEIGGNQTSQILNTDDLYCVARLPTGGNTWELINDTSHEPSSTIDGIVTNPAAGYNFSIQHNNGYTKVGSVVSTVDETYANFGLNIGASVGLTNTLFKVTKTGFTIRALVSGGVLSFANDTGQIVLDTDFTYTFDTGTGNMVISHPNITCTYGDGAILTPYGTAFTTRLVSKTPTSTTFQWYNNGVLVTALSTSMKLYYTRTGTFNCSNAQIGNSGANFWIRGIFKK